MRRDERSLRSDWSRLAWGFPTGELASTVGNEEKAVAGNLGLSFFRLSLSIVPLLAVICVRETAGKCWSSSGEQADTAAGRWDPPLEGVRRLAH